MIVGAGLSVLVSVCSVVSIEFSRFFGGNSFAVSLYAVRSDMLPFSNFRIISCGACSLMYLA